MLLLSSGLVLIYLLWTLHMVHPGDLHLSKASLRCYISLWKSSGPVDTVLALWVRVPITLYLIERLWWLSHCKYWSVWVGLQYILMDKELSASGLTKYQGKGLIHLLGLPSTVNLIAGSILLIWSKTNCLWDCYWMTKVSSRNLNQYLWGGGRPEGFSLKMLHVQVCYYWA